VATDKNFKVKNGIDAGGAITGTSIVKSGGTSSQFLKADGSVDSSTYLTTTGSGTGLTGIALLESSNTFTTTQTITPATSVTGLIINAAASSIGLIVKANATTPGSIQEWQNSLGSVLSYVDSAGKIFANGLRLDGSDGSNNNVYKTGTLGLLSGLGTQLYLNQDNNATGGPLTIRAMNAQTSNLTEWRNVAGTTVLASMSTTGLFSAVSKSFDIQHPTKPDMRLRYGSLEGPENGVYVRGNTKENVITLPDYWTGLVDGSTITVSLTSVGKFQKVYLKKIEGNKIYIGGKVKEISYVIFGERKDTPKLIVEY
jgi:hypothetical protein